MATVVLSIPAGVMAFAMGLGIEPEAVFEAAGLSPADLDDLDRHVDYGCLFDVWDLMRARFPDRALGLEVAAMFDASQLGLVGALIKSSRTLKESTERVMRYLHLVDPSMRFLLEVDGTDARLTIEPDARLRASPYPLEGIMAMQVVLPRAIAGDDFVLREVTFGHACFHTPEPYEHYFRAPVRFDAPEYALHFDASVLDRPLPGADENVARYLETLASRLAEERPQGPSDALVAEVRSALESALENGDASLPRVARMLAMSSRTLQRRLGEHGTSFAELQDEVFCRTATTLLRGRRHRVHEVAFLLGYSDASSFHRAFKRWTGQTPEQFRRS